MSEADDLRGTEVAIGKFKFEMPMEPPASDQDVIEREELIAKADRASAPFRTIADRAALVKKTIRDDITTAFRMRLDEKDQGPTLMDNAEVEEPTPKRGKKAAATA